MPREEMEVTYQGRGKVTNPGKRQRLHTQGRDRGYTPREEAEVIQAGKRQRLHRQGRELVKLPGKAHERDLKEESERSQGDTQRVVGTSNC